MNFILHWIATDKDLTVQPIIPKQIELFSNIDHITANWLANNKFEKLVDIICWSILNDEDDVSQFGWWTFLRIIWITFFFFFFTPLCGYFNPFFVLFKCLIHKCIIHFVYPFGGGFWGIGFKCTLDTSPFFLKPFWKTGRRERKNSY